MAGTWSCNATTPDRFPTKDLFHIIREAWLNAPTTLEALVIDEAASCALAHALDASGSEQSHCDYVLAAREHADNDAWSECIAALKHMGPVAVGTPVAPTTPWPCDTGGTPADVDVDLFTVIQLANFNAPPKKRSTILDRATECGLEHTADMPPPIDSATHCEKVHSAKEGAQSEDWDFCIEALDHTGITRRRLIQRRRRDHKIIAGRVEDMIREWSRPIREPDSPPDTTGA
jgi:hypothetical protein